jgi:hypothetical protein
VDQNKSPYWTWIIELDALMGVQIRLETNESMYRTGKLTRVRFNDIPFMGEIVPIPVGLELNGDDTDVIPFSLIKNVEQFQ